METRVPIEQNSSFYHPELDAIRFLAFMFVFFHHAFPREAIWYHKLFRSDWLCLFSASTVNAGGFGLCLFFTLSAYLIAELLRREKHQTGTVHIQTFYRRRILRIVPLYFLGMGLGLLFAALRFHFHRDALRLLSGAFMVENWYAVRHGWSGNPMTHLWSISVEGQFYLFWPWVALKAGKRGLYGTCLVMAAVANGCLIYLGHAHANLDYRIWANSFVQLYMFAAGILIALVLRGRVPRIRGLYRGAIFLSGLACWQIASLGFRIKQFGDASSSAQLVAGYSFVALGCAALLLSLFGANPNKFPPAVIYLGRISYGLYVYHLLGLDGAKWIAEHYFTFSYRDSIGTLLGLSFTIALAAASFRYFESPFLRAKRKLEYVRTIPS